MFHLFTFNVPVQTVSYSEFILAVIPSVYGFPKPDAIVSSMSQSITSCIYRKVNSCVSRS